MTSTAERRPTPEDVDATRRGWPLRDDAPRDQGAELFAGALCLRLEFRALGVTRKGDKSAIETDADRAMLKLSAAMLESPALDAIRSADNDLRRWVAARTVPAPLFRAGTYLAKLDAFDDIDQKIRDYEIARGVLVRAFLDDYDRAAEDGRRRLASQGTQIVYPSREAAGRQFGMMYAWLEIGAPQALARLDARQYQKQAAKMRDACDQALALGRAAVRAELADLVSGLAERLAPGPNGQKRIFRDTAIENLREWFALVRSREMTDDRAMLAIVEQGERLIAGVGADDLRTDADLRARIAADFAKMSAAAAELVIDAPARLYGEDF